MRTNRNYLLFRGRMDVSLADGGMRTNRNGECRRRALRPV